MKREERDGINEGSRCIDRNTTKKLFAYGLGVLQHVEDSKDSNFAKRELSPIWKQLKAELDFEYKINKRLIKKR